METNLEQMRAILEAARALQQLACNGASNRKRFNANCNFFTYNEILAAKKKFKIWPNPMLKKAPPISEKRVRRRHFQIERPFKCNLFQCPKAYGTASALRKHLELKHPNWSYQQNEQMSL